MDEKLYKKAIYQILGEENGFDEAKIYLDMVFLNKKFWEDFSVSKIYRIFQRLYELGFLFKIKNEEKNHYLPIPPSFLYTNPLIDKKIIDYLEKVYYKNHAESFKKKEMLFEAKGVFFEGLVIFLTKYLMKKEAILLVGGPDIPELLKKIIPQKIDLIKIIGRRDYFKNFLKGVFLLNGGIIGNRRILVIDESIYIESLKTPDKKYLGYLTTNIQNIKTLKEELLSLIK